MTDSIHRSALLVLDAQVGLADQPFAASAMDGVQHALGRARATGVLVVYSRVGFLPDYADVAPWNRAFAGYATGDRLPPTASRLVPSLQPAAGEPVFTKARFSPFTGTGLAMLLHSQSVQHVVLTGFTTSGVVLAAFSHAENHDLQITVLQDACADQDTTQHATLINLFRRSATVTTSEEWNPA